MEAKYLNPLTEVIYFNFHSLEFLLIVLIIVLKCNHPRNFHVTDRVVIMEQNCRHSFIHTIDDFSVIRGTGRWLLAVCILLAVVLQYDTNPIFLQQSPK